MYLSRAKPQNLWNALTVEDGTIYTYKLILVHVLNDQKSCGGSNASGGGGGLQRAAESKMAVANGIILSSSLVIIVGSVFCLAYVELYCRNNTKGDIAIFPLSRRTYPAGGRIYPKCREISIELET
jgi:hypothetical protein